MDKNKDRNLIYQYVFHNYDNEFHLLSELKRMMKDYYSEILSAEYFFDYEKFDTFSDGDLILKDIIPPIIKSKIVDVKLSDFKDENDLCSHSYFSIKVIFTIILRFEYLKVSYNVLRVGDVPRRTILDCAYTLLWVIDYG